MFPISILLGAQLALSSKKLNLLFVDLSRQLQKRLAAAKDLETRSRAYPVVVFRGDAVEAWVDRSQHGAIRKRRPPSGAEDLADGGRRFVRGLRRVPEIVEAYRVIPRTLRATSGLLATAVRFLDSTRRGTTVRSQLLEIAARSKNDPGGPGMLDALLGNTSRLPRIVAAGAVAMLSLADFLRALAADRGKELLSFGEGAHLLGRSMGEVFGELFPADPGAAGKPAATAAPRALHETLRDVVGGITFALLALPWLGLYLGPLFKKLLLGLKVTFVDILQDVEALGWDFRKAVLEVFFVSLETLRRRAVDWLVGGAELILSLLSFGTTFAEIYVFELFEGLRRVLGKISEVLATVTEVIRWIGIILGTLFKLNLASLFSSLPIGATLNFMDLIEAITGRKGPLAQALEAVRSGKASTGMTVEIRGASGRARITVLISGDKDPDPPKISAFPSLFADLIGTGPGSLLGIMKSLLGMTKTLVTDILLVGEALLVDAERRFDQLRQDAANLDLSASFKYLAVDSNRVVDRLLAPELERLDEQGGPTGFERMSGILAGVLVRGGFEMVGASIRGYVLELDRFWRAEKVAEELGGGAVVDSKSSSASRPTATSPHKLSRRARLGTVRVPRVAIKARGRALDQNLQQQVAGRVRRAVAEAHAAGRLRLAEAQAAG